MEDQASPAEGRPSLRLGLLPKAGWSLNPGTQCSPKNMMFIHEKTTKYIQTSQNIIENHGKTMPVFKTEFLFVQLHPAQVQPQSRGRRKHEGQEDLAQQQAPHCQPPQHLRPAEQTWTPE